MDFVRGAVADDTKSPKTDILILAKTQIGKKKKKTVKINDLVTMLGSEQNVKDLNTNFMKTNPDLADNATIVFMDQNEIAPNFTVFDISNMASFEKGSRKNCNEFWDFWWKFVDSLSHISVFERIFLMSLN